MLSRTVLSAEQLNITDAEHAALLKVRQMLVSGELQHEQDYALEVLDVPHYRMPHQVKLFNMNYFRYTTHGWPLCGTPRCIGGWMSALLATDHYSGVLMELFHPRYVQPNLGTCYSQITTKQAVAALDKFFAGAPASEWWAHVI